MPHLKDLKVSFNLHYQIFQKVQGYYVFRLNSFNIKIAKFSFLNNFVMGKDFVMKLCIQKALIYVIKCSKCVEFCISKNCVLQTPFSENGPVLKFNLKT